MANPYVIYTINLCKFSTNMINKITRAISKNKPYSIRLSGVELKRFNVNVRKNFNITLQSSKKITDKLIKYFQLFCDTYTQLSRHKVNSPAYNALISITRKLKKQFIEFLISSRKDNGGTPELPDVSAIVAAHKLNQMLPVAPTNSPMLPTTAPRAIPRS